MSKRQLEYRTIALAVLSRFIVRDFVFDESSIDAERQEISRLESDVKRQYVSALFF